MRTEQMLHPERAGFRLFSPAMLATMVAGSAGTMLAYLNPLVSDAMRERIGLSPVAAGAIITVALLGSSVATGGFVRLAARPRRRRLASGGLLVAFACFGIAAVVSDAVVVTIAMVLAALGGGLSCAAGSAAIAAGADPDRTAGLVSVFENLLAAGLLALVPVLGSGMLPVFGALAGTALLGALPAWRLPDAPGVREDEPARTSLRRAPGWRMGVLLVACALLWGTSQDVLWAVSVDLGAAHPGLNEQVVGTALSVSEVFALVGAVLATALGSRFGRMVPLLVFFMLNAAMQLLAFTTVSGPVFAVSVAVWNAAYTAALVYVIALSATLDVLGRWTVLTFSAYMIGTSLAPFVGSVLSGIGFSAMGGVVAACSMLVMVAFCGIAWRTRNSEVVSG